MLSYVAMSKKQILATDAANMLQKAEADETFKRRQLLESSYTSADSSDILSDRLNNNNMRQSRRTSIVESSNESSFEESTATCDIYTTMCNICWKSSLSLCTYVTGQPTIEFGSLWLDEEIDYYLIPMLKSSFLKMNIGNVVEMAILCGPLRVLKAISNNISQDINKVVCKGQSPTHIAVLSKNFEAFLYLITQPSWIDSKNSQGYTAESLCVESNMKKYFPLKNTSRKSSISSTSQSFSDMEAANELPGSDSNEPLFRLISDQQSPTDVLLYINIHNVSVNDSKHQGDHLVHFIVRHGLKYLPLLYVLVKHFGAHIDMPNDAGETCLLLAIKLNDAKLDNCVVADFLICVCGANPDLADSQGYTSLHTACALGRDDLVRLLLKRGADFNLEDNMGRLPDAVAKTGSYVECAALIEQSREERRNWLFERVRKALLSKRDIRQSDLALVEMTTGNTMLMMAVIDNVAASVRLLLGLKCMDINAQNAKNLKTALIIAAELGRNDMLDDLFVHGANPAIKDIDGLNALQHAVRLDRLSTVEELIKRKSTWNDLTRTLEMCRSANMRECIESIRRKRQDNVITPTVMDCTCNENMLPVLQTLFESGDDVNKSTDEDSWPLYKAAEHGRLDVMKEFCEMGGDVKRRHTPTGNTLLHIAALHGNADMVAFLLAKYKALAASDDNSHLVSSMVNMVNYEDQVPLVLAAEGGYSAVAQLLLDHGATSSVVDKNGKLYDGGPYDGLKVLISQHRASHSAIIMAAIRDHNNKALGRLKDTFLVPFDHNVRDTVTQDTPLMVAALSGNEAALDFLLQSAIYHTYDVFPNCDKETLPRRLDSGCFSDAQAAANGHRNSSQRRSDPNVHSRADANMRADFHVRAADPRIRAVFNVHAEPSDRESATGSQPDMESFLESVSQADSPNVWSENGIVNHLCAISPRDGCTVYHRAVQGSKDVAVLQLLLKKDSRRTAINFQDKDGLGPLHVACKLNKHKAVELLCNQQSVDLNLLSLDGKLPEEITDKKSIKFLVTQARAQGVRREPQLDDALSLASTRRSDSTIDFDRINTRFRSLMNSVHQ